MDQLERNKMSMNNHIDSIMKKYSRVLSVRLDLYFLKNSYFEYDARDLQYYFAKFIKAVNNSINLKDYIAYFRVFELGQDKGLHCHCLFMYNGQKRQNDYWIGKCLGELWVRVTEGRGDYYNVNSSDSKERIRSYQQSEMYREDLLEICRVPSVAEDIFQETLLGLESEDFNTLGVGMLKRSDNVGWMNVRALANYFCKKEQSLPSGYGRRIRSFAQSSRLRPRG